MDDLSRIQTLLDLVTQLPRAHAERPALCSTEGACVTYGELGDYTRAVASHLRELGVQPGDRVALLAENRPEWGIWYLGVTAMGAVILPILTDFSATEVQSIVHHAEPRVAVTSETTRDLLGGWSEGRVLDCGVVHELPSAEDSGAPLNVDPGAEPGARPPVHPDTCAALIYTSGTTGNPKGVMLSHGNLISNAKSVREIFAVAPNDALLSVLPLAHTYECTIGFLVPMLSGASVTYLSGPPSPSRLLPALETVRPTIMLTVPLIIEKIYRARVVPKLSKLPPRLRRFPPARKLFHRLASAKLKRTFGGRMRVFGIGGAPLGAQTERFLREGRFPYCIGYGLTETSPLLAGTAPFETKFRSTGPAVPGVELRLDPTDAESVSGNASHTHPVRELQAYGPNLMLGYFKNPAETAAAFTEDGWFKTGDLAWMDEGGYVYIQGRVKTLIVGPSGENIYPEEIEATIESEPLVEESLVISKGGKLVALVRLNLDALADRLGTFVSELDPQTIRDTGAQLLGDIKREVNSRLNRFSRVAQMVLQLEEFERTPTRKIKRFLYQDDDTQAD
ncbi:MAG: AMP-binding protein [Spirochaetota bacterium]